MSGKRRKIFQIGFFYLFALVLLFTDQIAKAFAEAAIQPGESVPVLENILHMTLVHNTGAAFGLMRGHPGIFTVISISAAVFINFLYIKANEKLNAVESAGLCLILSGTLGNLVDRLREGYVIDFIDFRVWPVFNLADTWITVGAVLLGVGLLFAHRGGGQRQEETLA